MQHVRRITVSYATRPGKQTMQVKDAKGEVNRKKVR